MLSGTPDGTLLKLRVTPGAKKSEIMGEAGGRLRIRLQAPPVEGKANRELLRFIARELGLKKNRVALAGGEKITGKNRSCCWTCRCRKRRPGYNPSSVRNKH